MITSSNETNQPDSANQSYFLMTFHGHFLCVNPEDGSIMGYGMRQLPPNVTVLRLAARMVYTPGFFGFVAGDQPAPLSLPVPAGPVTDIVPVGPGRCVALASNGMFATAKPDGRLCYDKEAVLGWERFLPVTAEEIDILNHVLDNSWAIASSGAVVPPEKIRIGPDFGLWFDDLCFDLSYNLPLAGAGQQQAADLPPFSIKLLREGWRVDEARLYRPMVYSAAFRDLDVHGQLSLCLQSLLAFGRYDGAVHVITDRPAPELLASLPGLDPARLTIQHVAAADFTGFVGSKYLILDHPPAWRAQPLLFVDPDIIFDAPLRPILGKIACLDRIAAPLEDTSPLRSTISVGASLIQRDLGDPRLAHGFNAGTLGIPNLAAHGGVLDRIRRIMVNFAAQNGRQALAWVDQEIANYVAFRTGLFDTHTLSPHLRWGSRATAHEARARAGLVHFWPARTPAAKREAMEAYVEALKAMDEISATQA